MVVLPEFDVIRRAQEEQLLNTARWYRQILFSANGKKNWQYFVFLEQMKKGDGQVQSKIC